MTIITWAVTAMDCYPTVGEKTDVVCKVHWKCEGVNGAYNASVDASGSMSPPRGEFTPYAQLTQSQVLDWVWDNCVDRKYTEAEVEQLVQNKINPPIVTLALPWSD